MCYLNNRIDNHYSKHLNDYELDENESFHEVTVVANINLIAQKVSYGLYYSVQDYELKRQSIYYADMQEYQDQTIYI